MSRVDKIGYAEGPCVFIGIEGNPSGPFIRATKIEPFEVEGWATTLSETGESSTVTPTTFVCEWQCPECMHGIVAELGFLCECGCVVAVNRGALQ